MPTWFENLKDHVRLADIIDIALWTTLVYIAISWIRRRASYAVAFAFVVAGATYLAAHLLGMYVTLFMFRAGLTVLALSLVIIFQQDLRRAFEQFSSWRPWRRDRVAESEKSRNAIIDAVATMAEQKTGALIVLQGKEPLEPHVRGGIKLGGQISMPLLLSIFHSKTPGHDGAVIIHRDRLAQFAVHLPLSSNVSALGPGGTRHAAALGLAECSDAFVITVSEERGTVSVAHEHKLTPLESPVELQKLLSDFDEKHSKSSPTENRVSSFVGGLGLKFAAAATAILLWFGIAYQVDAVMRSYEKVPVEFRNIPEGWAVDNVFPNEVRLVVTGTERAFRDVRRSDFTVSIDLADPQPTGLRHRTFPITPERVRLPLGMTLSEADPSTVQLELYRISKVRAPIGVRHEGQRDDGWELADVRINPPSVRVIVPDGEFETVPEIPTNTIELSELAVKDKQTMLTATLVPPDGIQLAENEPQQVNVTLIWKKPPAPMPKQKSQTPPQ
ncbi:diadenylate cyclase [Thalassoroseus pseudoceratinae]|uniref:diadenylate cyclase n=1 Tax=Thalassoroseus pseudoceratinae TaxID=2713176 RepID=UPI001422A6B0|nr:diadenylate cyclase [Thalassoroseus pseudoceratinae]